MVSSSMRPVGFFICVLRLLSLFDYNSFFFPLSLFCCKSGLTGSIVLRNGRLSDLILQLQELLKGVNEAEVSNNKFDSTLIAAQVLLLNNLVSYSLSLLKASELT